MRILLITLVVLLNTVCAQSEWQVYEAPYKVGSSYTYCDNTGTGPFMIWWKKDVGINYSSIPSSYQALKDGIDYAVTTNAWSNQSYINFTTGNDVQVFQTYFTNARGYLAGAELMTFDSGTGQVTSAEIEINTGLYDHPNGFDYNLVWLVTDISYQDHDADIIYLDTRAEMTHEIGHILGIFHPKNGTLGEAMSSFGQAEAAGVQPALRRFLKTNDWAALNFLYDFPPLAWVTTSGNSTLYSGQTGIWNADHNEARPAFTYNWEIKYVDGGGYLESYAEVLKMKQKKEKEKKGKDDPIIEVAPPDEWVPVGTNSPYFEKPHNPYDLRDFYLRCTVTDLNNNTKTSPAFFVDVVSYPPPQSNIVQTGNPETTPIAKSFNETTQNTDAVIAE